MFNNTIKVWPTKRAYLKVLSHPQSGPLRDREDGTSWLDDSYTKRLLAEGSISKTKPVTAEEKE